MPYHSIGNQPISFESHIPVSAGKVWNQMIAPGNAVLWHPFVKEHIAKNWSGIGSKDKVIYNNGATFEREVIDWLEGIGFDLKVTQNGKNEIIVSWRVKKSGEKNCRLKVTAHVVFLKKLPLPIRWAVYKFKIKPAFSNYLELSMKGFAYYATNGKKVRRNQFGAHPLFSP
ncbi:MAG TPA: SRPBCC family protein [Bacteroidales bacterium]|nr:SRPBCC family protein [Bacteroidales bacterium]HKK68706.1 SRPBCC family protein [Bacteroidales bacterium]